MSTEVPTGWSFTRIGDFATESRATSLGDEEVLSVTKYDGFVRSLDYFGKRVFSGSTEKYKRVERGQFAYATIHLDEGSIALLDDFEAGIISPMYTVFGVNTAQVDRDFLINLLKTPRLLRRYSAIGEGTVNRRRSIGFKSLANEYLALPPLAEQRKIAAILGSVDDAIRATEAVIEQTRRLKAGLLQDLLTRGIGPDGRPHTELQETELGPLPVGWTVRRLGEVAEVRSGISKNANRKLEDPISVAYLRVANVQDGHIDLSEVKYIEIDRGQLERYQLKTGDVLMNEGGDIDKLGRGDVWSGELEPCVHQNHVFSVRCSAVLKSRFLADWAASCHGKAYFLSKGKQTTNLASINKGQLKAMPVPLPSLEEQAKIGDRISSVTAQIEAESARLTQLRRLKTGLLQDLLTGAVRVTP